MLITKEQMQRIPDLYSQEESKNPIVYLKITCLNSFWLITELDKKDGIAFGFCQILEKCGELGYVSLQEIEDLKSTYPVQIEEVRKTLSELKNEMA